MFQIAILTFLGLIVGLLIGKYTKSEIKSGKTYFLVAYKLAIFVLFLASLYFAWYSPIPLLVIAFIAGILFSFGLKNLYFYLGMLFVLAFWARDLYSNVVAVLIFMTGLLRGGLIVETFSKKRNIRKRVILSLVFFAIPFVMVFFKDFILTTHNVVYAFISGAIFMEFVKKLDL
jgi:hypothetical protein